MSVKSFDDSSVKLSQFGQFSFDNVVLACPNVGEFNEKLRPGYDSKYMTVDQEKLDTQKRRNVGTKGLGVGELLQLVDHGAGNVLFMADRCGLSLVSSVVHRFTRFECSFQHPRC